MIWKDKKVCRRCLLLLVLCIGLNFPYAKLNTAIGQWKEKQSLAKESKVLQKEIEMLETENVDKQTQVIQLQEQLAGKTQEYEKLAAQEEKLLEYIDIIREYDIAYDDELQVPWYLYDFEYANEVSVTTNIGGTVMDILFGSTLWGSLINDNVQKNITEDDLAFIEALCSFNQAMETYINDHAGALNESSINEDIKDFSQSITAFSDDTEENLKNIIYIEKLIGEEIKDGRLIRIRKLDEIEQLIPVYLASRLVTSGYDAVIRDSSRDGSWKNFTDKCYKRLFEYYTEDELKEIIINQYQEEVIYLNHVYYELLDKSCFSPVGENELQCGIKTVFVQGEGDRSIRCYCKEEKEQIYCIKVLDNNGIVRVVCCYDSNGWVTMVKDVINNREYHYYYDEPVGVDLEQPYGEVLEFAKWIESLFRSGEKINKSTYESMRQCFAK